MSWQHAFAAYTTGVAFHVSLSHDQASLIAHMGTGQKATDWVSRSGRNTFVPTVKGLIKRGLVEHNLVAANPSLLVYGARVKWHYRLTPAGQHVLALLKLCGLASVGVGAKPDRLPGSEAAREAET